MPRGMPRKTSNILFEFHRICQELQDISTRTYRSHIDLNKSNNINVKFLLGDYDEKTWGQNLGRNERLRKRDGEVQEIFAAFRMVAVELINRVQNYRSEDGKIRIFADLPVVEAEKFIEELGIEIKTLITMINDALINVIISYNYSVPYIYSDGIYYSIKTKNFSDEVKKRRDVKDVTDETINPTVVNSVIIPSVTDTTVTDTTVTDTTVTAPTIPVIANTEDVQSTRQLIKRKKPVVATMNDNTDDTDDVALQAAIVASLSM
jgi:hypothetical protein